MGFQLANQLGHVQALIQFEAVPRAGLHQVCHRHSQRKGAITIQMPMPPTRRVLLYLCQRGAFSVRASLRCYQLIYRRIHSRYLMARTGGRALYAVHWCC